MDEEVTGLKRGALVYWCNSAIGARVIVGCRLSDVLRAVGNRGRVRVYLSRLREDLAGGTHMTTVVRPADFHGLHDPLSPRPIVFDLPFPAPPEHHHAKGRARGGFAAQGPSVAVATEEGTLWDYTRVGADFLTARLAQVMAGHDLKDGDYDTQIYDLCETMLRDETRVYALCAVGTEEPVALVYTGSGGSAGVVSVLMWPETLEPDMTSSALFPLLLQVPDIAAYLQAHPMTPTVERQLSRLPSADAGTAEAVRPLLHAARLAMLEHTALPDGRGAGEYGANNPVYRLVYRLRRDVTAVDGVAVDWALSLDMIVVNTDYHGKGLGPFFFQAMERRLLLAHAPVALRVEYVHLPSLRVVNKRYGYHESPPRDNQDARAELYYPAEIHDKPVLGNGIDLIWLSPLAVFNHTIMDRDAEQAAVALQRTACGNVADAGGMPVHIRFASLVGGEASVTCSLVASAAALGLPGKTCRELQRLGNEDDAEPTAILVELSGDEGSMLRAVALLVCSVAQALWRPVAFDIGALPSLGDEHVFQPVGRFVWFIPSLRRPLVPLPPPAEQAPDATPVAEPPAKRPRLHESYYACAACARPRGPPEAAGAQWSRVLGTTLCDTAACRDAFVYNDSM